MHSLFYLQTNLPFNLFNHFPFHKKRLIDHTIQGDAMYNKLERIDDILIHLPLDSLLHYSLEDLQDAYLVAKAKTFKQRLNDIMDLLEKTKERKQCHYLYREIENLEEMLYLVEKRYSKTLKKQLKQAKKKHDQ